MLKFALALQLAGLALLFAGEWSDKPLPFLGAAAPLFVMATVFLIRWFWETRPEVDD